VTAPIYEPGESVELYCDISHAMIDPLPAGVPAGTRLRVVVTQRALTVGWLSPTGEIGRVDLPMSEADTAEVTYMGGPVGGYAVGRAPGCSGCGAAGLNRWVPFDNITYLQRMPPGQIYGVPPQRDELTGRYHRA
jgi:hypothetical protein